jgi:hypothetical protein
MGVVLPAQHPSRFLAAANEVANCFLRRFPNRSVNNCWADGLESGICNTWLQRIRYRLSHRRVSTRGRRHVYRR